MPKTMVKIRPYILLWMLVLILTSCKEKRQDPQGDMLVKIGNLSLSRQEMEKEMPSALERDDSVKFARNYIRNWIGTHLIEEIAVKNIDMTEIDRMVENYRRELVIWEYRRQMYDQNASSEIPEDSVANYYRNHKEQFKIQRPLVKGIYIKIRENAPNLSKLRKWYRSKKSGDIEKLEKYGLTGAIHYDYFRDKWIDWEQIESKIPYDFGNDADAFLKTHSNVETSSGGYLYLLDITEYLPTNSVMPFDVAKSLIQEQLLNQNKLQYERQLDKELFDKALEDGKIEIFCDIDS